MFVNGIQEMRYAGSFIEKNRYTIFANSIVANNAT